MLYNNEKVRFSNIENIWNIVDTNEKLSIAFAACVASCNSKCEL